MSYKEKAARRRWTLSLAPIWTITGTTFITVSVLCIAGLVAAQQQKKQHNHDFRFLITPEVDEDLQLGTSTTTEYEKHLARCQLSRSKIYLSFIIRSHWSDIVNNKRALSKLSKFFAIPKEYFIVEDISRSDIYEMIRYSIMRGPNHVAAMNSKKLARLEFVVGCNREMFPIGKRIVNQVFEQMKDGVVGEISGLKLEWWSLWTKRPDNRVPRLKIDIEGSGNNNDNENGDDDNDEDSTLKPPSDQTYGLQQYHAESLKPCKSENQSGVEWQATYEDPYVVSNPLCLDEYKFPQTRSCMNGTWDSEPPKCSYYQESFNLIQEIEKMTGLKHVENVLTYNYLFVSEKKPWTNGCLKFGSMFDLNYLSRVEVPDDFWLPLKRYRKYFPFIELALGPNWGKVMDIHTTDDGDCMVLNVKENKTEAVSCTDNFIDICIVDHLRDPVQIRGLEVCLRTPLQRDKCFKLSTGQNATCKNYFYYETPLHDFVYRKFFDRHTGCRIQIPPFEGQELFDKNVWENKLKTVNYTNWLPRDYSSTEIPQQGFVVADSNGQWYVEKEVNCAICEIAINDSRPEMFLKFDQKSEKLELTILNWDSLCDKGNWYYYKQPSPLINCYTTASNALLINTNFTEPQYNVIDFGEVVNDLNIFEHEYIKTITYSVEVLENGPGEYWCDGLVFTSSETVTSPIVVAYKNKRGEVYAFHSTYICFSNNCSTEFQTTDLIQYSSSFKSVLEKNFSKLNIVDVRVMDVLEVLNKQISFLFHVTVTSQEKVNFKDEDSLIQYINDMLDATEQHNNELYNITSIYHTSKCVGSFNTTELYSARIGEKIVIARSCPNDNIVLEHRACKGSFPYGVQWGGKEEEGSCDSATRMDHSKEVYRLAHKPDLNMTDVEQFEILTFENEIDSTQLYSMGYLMKNLANDTSNKIAAKEELQIVTQILCNAFEADKIVAKEGHSKFGATDTIIDNYEKILNNLASDPLFTNESSFDEWGVMSTESRNVLSFIIDPSIRNVSGIAIFRPKECIRNLLNFNNFKVEYLFDNTSTDVLAERPLLEVASFIPIALLNNLTQSQTSNKRSPIRIVMSFLKKSTLFQNPSQTEKLTPIGKVIQISIPGYGPNFHSPIPILYRIDKSLDISKLFCKFWKFHDSTGSSSEWSIDQVQKLAKSSKNKVLVCGSTHLTNFAVLTSGKLNSLSCDYDSKSEIYNLDMITIISCTLSFFGILCIWITAVRFRSWREMDGTKILLQLSYGISIQMSLMLISNIEGIFPLNKVPCIGLGIGLHYSVLVTFAWMLIAGYLQYKRFVVVIGNLLPENFKCKSMTIGWIVPLIPILIIISIDSNLYVPIGGDGLTIDTICYPQGDALLFGVIIPIAIVLVINICVFSIVIYNITKGFKQFKGKNTNNKIYLAQLRLTILLFFLFGLTWISGCLVHFMDDVWIFNYIFCATATLQGFILFLYFVILDPQTRHLWVSSMKCFNNKESSSVTYTSK